MIFSVVACSNENNTDNNSNTGNTPVLNNNTNNNDTNSDEDDDTPVGEGPSGQLIIGSTTELTGDWITYFQNNASDREILDFITRYTTVDMTFAGEYLINETVVDNLETTENPDGSKTYTWKIKPGITYNNGEEITAYDYVAGMLLWNSKFLADLNGQNQANYRWLVMKPMHRAK